MEGTADADTTTLSDRDLRRGPLHANIYATLWIAGAQLVGGDIHGVRDPGSHIAATAEQVLIYLHDLRAAQAYPNAWFDAVMVADQLPETVHARVFVSVLADGTKGRGGVARRGQPFATWAAHRSGPKTSYRIRDGGTPLSSRVDLTCRMNGSGPQVNTCTSAGSGICDRSIKPCRER